MRPQPSQEWVEREMEEERLRRIAREKELMMEGRKTRDIDTVSPCSVMGRDIITHEDIVAEDFYNSRKGRRGHSYAEHFDNSYDDDLASSYRSHDRSDVRRTSYYHDRDYFDAAHTAYGAVRDDLYAARHARSRMPPRRAASLPEEERIVHPREHYEMLKLHRINLMEEIQETSLMLNLCEQQILEEEQEEMYLKQKAKLHRSRVEKMETYRPIRSRLLSEYEDVEGDEKSDRYNANRKVRFEDETHCTESTYDMDSQSNSSDSSEKKRSLCDEENSSIDSGKRMKIETVTSPRSIPKEVIA